MNITRYVNSFKEYSSELLVNTRGLSTVFFTWLKKDHLGSGKKFWLVAKITALFVLFLTISALIRWRRQRNNSRISATRVIQNTSLNFSRLNQNAHPTAPISSGDSWRNSLADATGDVGNPSAPSPPKITNTSTSSVLSSRPQIRANPFKELSEYPLMPITSNEDAQYNFCMFCADFMDLTLSNGNSNIPASFLISQLQSYSRQSQLQHSNKLNGFIEKLKYAYYFDRCVSELRRYQNDLDYIDGRNLLKTKMLTHLREKGSLLLKSGYAARPTGHELKVELVLADDYTVVCYITNLGAGVEHHDYTIGERTKYHRLQLKRITLHDLENSYFIDHVINFHKFNLMLEDNPGVYLTPDTMNSSGEFYANIIAEWPVAKDSRTDSKYAHSPQWGPSCPVKSDLVLLRELLEPRMYGNVKIFLQIQAINELLNFPNLAEIDIKRLKDALNKLNREAVLLNNKQSLENFIWNQLTHLTTRVKLAIKQVHLEKSDLLLQEEWIDNSFFNYAVFNPHRSITPVPIKQPSSPEFCLKSYLLGHQQITASEVKSIHSKMGNNFPYFVYQIFSELPNPSDPFWTTYAHPDRLFDLVSYLKTEFNKSNTTSAEIILFLKTITIMIVLLDRYNEARDVSDYLKYQMNQLLFSLRKRWRFTDPTHRKVYLDCRDILKTEEATQNQQSPFEPNYLFKRTFNSKAEILADPELNFYYMYKTTTYPTFNEGILTYLPDENTKTTPRYFSMFLETRNLIFKLYNLTLMNATNSESLIETQYITFENKTQDYFYHSTDLSKNRINYGLFHLFTEDFQEFKSETDRVPDSNFMVEGSCDEANENHILSMYANLRNIRKDANKNPIPAMRFFRFLSHKTFKIPLMISYFTNHFYLFNTPYYQAFFSYSLFAPTPRKTLFIEEMFKSPCLMKFQLLNFIKSALSNTKKLNWVDAHLHFLRTLAQLTRYAYEVEGDFSFKTAYYTLLQSHIEHLLKDPLPDDPHKSKAFYAILSCAPYFTYPEAKVLLELCRSAQATIHELGMEEQLTGRLFKHDLATAQHLLATSITNSQLLPSWIVNHKNYFFGKNFKATPIDGGFAFSDQNTQYRIMTFGHEIEIHREISGLWYVFQEINHNHPELLDHHPFKKGCLAKEVRDWVALDDSEMMTHCKQSDKLLCITRRDSNEIFHPINRTLRLCRNYSHQNLNKFSKILPLTDLLVWKNENHEIVLLELTSLHVSFYKEDGKWKSKNYPGFSLDFTFESSFLRPFPHCLIMKNKKDKRIVLIPNDAIRSSRQRYINRLTVDELSEIMPRRELITLGITAKGKIEIPYEGNKAIFLIYLSMRRYHYKYAQKVLNKVRREFRDFSETGTTWIKELLQHKTTNTKKDNHPHAIVIRLQLAVLLSQNENLQRELLLEIVEDYFIFLERRKHAFGISLSLNDELAVVRLIRSGDLNNKQKHQLNLRCQRIDPSFEIMPILDYYAHPHVPNWNVKCAIPSFDWISLPVLSLMIRSKDAPIPIALRHRPGIALIKNFFYYYNILRSSPKNSEEYRSVLSIIPKPLFETDPTTLKVWSVLLPLVHLNREDYPTLENILNGIQEPFNQTSVRELKNRMERSFATELRYSMANIISQIKQYYLSPADKSYIFEPTAPQSSSNSNVKASSSSSSSYISSSSSTSPQSPVILFESTIEEVDFLTLFDSFFTDYDISNELRQQEEILEEMRLYFTEGLKTATQPCEEKEWQKYVTGIEKRREQLQTANRKTQEQRIICNTKLEDLKNALDAKGSQLLLEQETLATSIRAQIDQIPPGLQLERDGNMLPRLSLDQLIVHYGRGNDQAILESNPSLTPDDLKRLKTTLFYYLIVATDYQHLVSISNRLSEVVDTSSLIELSKFFMQKRVYDIHQDTPLLVFEYFQKIRLRADQYEELQKLVNSDINMERQIKTGFGKSKVLIPLWLFLKGQHDKIAMMAVPSSLFIAQDQHLKQVLGDAFDASVLTIKFQRTDTNNISYLQKILKKLQSAREEKKVVLIDIQSLHGIVNLKWKEISYETAENNRELLSILSEIKKIIRNDTFIFFDESKECFDIHHRYDYAVGAGEPVEPESIETAFQIYHELFLRTDLTHHYSFEFFTPFSLGIQSGILIEENYDIHILPILAENAVALLELPQEHQNTALLDLQGITNDKTESLYAFLTTYGKLDHYSRLKKQLTTNLRRTLYRKCGDSYITTEKSPIATPCAAGIPKPTSEFSDVDDALNFTIQGNMKREFKTEEVQRTVDELKLEFLKNNIDLNKRTLIERLAKTSLLSVDSLTIELITAQLNENPAEKLLYIKLFILPLTKVYPKKVVSTAFNLIRSLDHLHAASGTSNPDVLPPKLISIPDETAILDNLMNLWIHSMNAITFIPGGRQSDQLNALLREDATISVIIDVSCQFRDLTLIELGDLILRVKENYKGVLLFDDEGHECIYSKDTQCLIPLEDSPLTMAELFVFIRKSKAIGTDLDLPLNAHAIVTIDKDSSSDLFFQGSGRMRQLSRGQRITYAVNSQDRSILFPHLPSPRLDDWIPISSASISPIEKAREIKAKPTFQNLLTYLIQQQSKKRGKEFFEALRMYLEDLIGESTKGITEFLVKTSNLNPESELRKQRKVLPIRDAIEQLKRELFSHLTLFLETHPDSHHQINLAQIEKDFDSFVDYSKLPIEIQMTDSSLVSSLEVDAIAENTSDAVNEESHEQSNENDFQNEQTTDGETFIPRFAPTPSLPWDGDYTDPRGITCEPEKIFGISIYHSPNYKRVSDQEIENTYVRKPAYFNLITINGKEVSILLLDLHDAEAVYNFMRNCNTPKNPIASTAQYFLVSDNGELYRTGKQSILKSKNWKKLRLLYKLFNPYSKLIRSDNMLLEKITKKNSDEAKKYWDLRISLKSKIGC